MAALGADPVFLALHETPLQTDFTPKYGQMVSVGGTPAFVVPASKGVHGGIVLFHEFWGLNNQIKETAEKLHEDTGGDGVVAVDLYGGKIGATAAEAGQLMQRVNTDNAKMQIEETVRAIGEQGLLGGEIHRIGTIGYCFGGGWSLQTALSNNDAISACVMYYGSPELDLQRLSDLKAPLLAFYGTQDPRLNPPLVEKFKKALEADHKKFQIFSYDAPHAFANPSNPHFNKEATEDSWKKTIAFFDKYLNK